MRYEIFSRNGHDSNHWWTSVSWCVNLISECYMYVMYDWSSSDIVEWFVFPMEDIMIQNLILKTHHSQKSSHKMAWGHHRPYIVYQVPWRTSVHSRIVHFLQAPFCFNSTSPKYMAKMPRGDKLFTTKATNHESDNEMVLFIIIYYNIWTEERFLYCVKRDPSVGHYFVWVKLYCFPFWK